MAQFTLTLTEARRDPAGRARRRRLATTRTTRLGFRFVQDLHTISEGPPATFGCVVDDQGDENADVQLLKDIFEHYRYVTVVIT
jgi:hypothetical protein